MKKVTPNLNKLLLTFNTECFDHFNCGNGRNSYPTEYLSLYLTRDILFFVFLCLTHHHYHHQSLNRERRWGTTDGFATSFLHFPLFSTAHWDLPNSRPVHSLTLSSHLFLCLPCLLPPFTVPYKMVLADLMNGKHDHTTAVCVSLRSSGSLRVVQSPAGSWHGLPRW